MKIFYRPFYESEATQFIDQIKAKNPELAVKQRQGLKLLWDKAVDWSAWRGYRAAQIKQNPYVYQTNTD